MNISVGRLERQWYAMQNKASSLYNTEDERYVEYNFFFPVCYMSDVNQRYSVNKFSLGHSASEIKHVFLRGTTDTCRVWLFHRLMLNRGSRYKGKK